MSYQASTVNVYDIRVVASNTEKGYIPWQSCQFIGKADPLLDRAVIVVVCVSDPLSLPTQVQWLRAAVACDAGGCSILGHTS
jgi:hypothetical protein